MKWPDIYLLCFATGSIWSVATLLLGGAHWGHGHSLHLHHHGSGAHGAHGFQQGAVHWLSSMLNPNSLAVFLAWFGGVGYLLTRHTGLLFWIDGAIACGFGLFGAWLLAAFLRFLQAREKPLDPADYEMVGVLGRVSSPVRPGGVGEFIFVRDGARRPVCARSEDGGSIERGAEVVVTRFERGIAYVRTWDALLALPGAPSATPAKEKESVE